MKATIGLSVSILAVLILQACSSPLSLRDQTVLVSINTGLNPAGGRGLGKDDVRAFRLQVRADDMDTLESSFSTASHQIRVLSGSARQFSLWALNDNGIMLFEGSIIADILSGASQSLTINLSRKHVTVSFDSRGGSEITPLLVPSGESFTPPEVPIQGELVFGGWYLDEAATQTWNFNTDTAVTDITLYAKWHSDAAVVSLLSISGVTAPVRGATPVTSLPPTDQYSGSIRWNPPVSEVFAPETVYTATINLVAKAGFTFTGIAENSFLVAGATSVSNLANSGEVTAVFPATGAPEDIPVKFLSLGQSGGVSATSDTTALVLTFDVDPSSLTTEHISLAGATKGALSGTGLSRTLSLSELSVGNGQSVTLTLTSPPGYAISNATRSAVVFRAPEQDGLQQPESVQFVYHRNTAGQLESITVSWQDTQSGVENYKLYKIENNGSPVLVTTVGASLRNHTIAEPDISTLSSLGFAVQASAAGAVSSPGNSPTRSVFAVAYTVGSGSGAVPQAVRLFSGENYRLDQPSTATMRGPWLSGSNNTISQRFAGWHDGLEIKQPGTQMAITGDLTLTAQWTSDGNEMGKIGPAGGYIFAQFDNAGQPWFLEAAPKELEFTAAWSGSEPESYLKDMTAPTALGHGKSNTLALDGHERSLFAAGNSFAASLTLSVNHNSYDDWYLPARDELLALYNQLFLNGVGDLEPSLYWSSSFYETVNPWAVNMGNDTDGPVDFDITAWVRPIRAFKSGSAKPSYGIAYLPNGGSGGTPEINAQHYELNQSSGPLQTLVVNLADYSKSGYQNIGLSTTAWGQGTWISPEEYDFSLEMTGHLQLFILWKPNPVASWNLIDYSDPIGMYDLEPFGTPPIFENTFGRTHLVLNNATNRLVRASGASAAASLLYPDPAPSGQLEQGQTISFWIYGNSLGTGSMLGRYTAGNTEIWRVGSMLSGQLHVVVENTYIGGSVYDFGTGLLADQWNHIAVRFLTEGGAGSAAVYVNGTQIDTDRSFGNPDRLSMEGEFYIGNAPYDGSGAGNSWLGRIANVRLYNVALSAYHIQAVYAGGNGWQP